MKAISRRTVLKGLGTAIALPFLDAMMPSRAFGATTSAASAAKAAIGPRRVAWLYVPNGITMQEWTPAAEGVGFELTRILKPLEAFREKLTVLSGLVCDKANPNGDGPGDHARAMAAFLTGAQPRKSEGATIRVGMSADQAVAERIGHLTKFPSLELGIEEGKQVGKCDSGYACAYSHNISWRNDTTPVVKDCNPQSVFDRLFGNADPRETAEAKAKREARRKSVLDFAMADARSLQGQMGASDKRKMDEYFASIREIEIRLAKSSTEEPQPLPEGVTRPGEIVMRDFPVHMKLIMDMMVLAFQGDLTRVVTLPFAGEASDMKYPWCDADVPHHSTSHHMNNPEKIELITKINVFHMQQVAYLLSRLDAIHEGNGSILDNSMIAYGSGNSDGNRHNHDNLPVLLMGKGGGTVASGRHVRYDNVPVNNLWVAMMDRVDAHHDKFGDATGSLKIS